jgi:hypothetical protein
MDLLETFLQNGTIEQENKREYDLRYFYVHGGCGYYTSGVVAQITTILLRRHRFTTFKGKLWYKVVGETNNPVVKGIIAEQICLNRIASSGFRIISNQLTDMDSMHFKGIPKWDSQISKEKKCQLYIPEAFNFPFIDGVVLLLNLKDRHAEMFPMQITISKYHKQSHIDFCKDLWPKWSKTLQLEGYSVSLTFIWIVKDKHASKVGNSHPSSSYEGNNGPLNYSVKVVEIREISEDLDHCL